MNTKIVSTAVLLAVLLALPAAATRKTAENKVRTGNQAYFDGKYQKAKNYFTRGINADRTWAVPYNNRGLAECRLGQFASGEADFDAAKNRDASYVAPYLNKGKCLASQASFSEAQAELEAGLKIDPRNKKLLYNLAWVKDELGDYAGAVSLYQKALAIDRRYADAQEGLAIALAKNGNTKKAVEAFYDRINARGSGSDLETAISAYNLQLLRGPGLTFPNKTAAEDYADAVFLVSVERYDLAVPMLESAQASAPEVADVPWVLAWTHLFRHDGNAAAGTLADAYALMPALEIDTASTTAEVFIDGIYRGETPASVEVFPGRFDVSWRSDAGGARRERTVVAYSDGTPGGDSPITVTTAATSKFSPFSEEQDRDRDWLGDVWEKANFGDLSADPDQDSDGDGSINLYEYWDATPPATADQDN